MKAISVGEKIAYVDKEDFSLLNRHQWRLHSDGYACKIYGANILYMHTLILPPRKGFVIDHIDQDKLNNIKSNLRYLTNHQNLVNSKRYTHKYVGISYHAIAKKWRARVEIKGKEKHLGLFTCKEEALKARTKFLWEHNV